MRIAVQEDMLPGRSMLEKFQNAEKLGIDGIEFWGKGLTDKVPDIVEAMTQTNVVASTVNHGRQSRFLDPELDERERALAELRESITNCYDIQAKGVIFVPHFFGPLLPDLMPWKSAVELEIELLFMHLRTLSDFAEAVGVDLYLEPVNRYETHFLNKLEHAATITRRLNHPRVKIVADMFHMALDEADIPAAIRAHAADIGHVHLADSNRRLPMQGTTDFTAAAEALREIGYEGWAAYECGDPGDNAPRSERYMADLPASIGMVRGCGFSKQ